MSDKSQLPLARSLCNHAAIDQGDGEFIHALAVFTHGNANEGLAGAIHQQDDHIFKVKQDARRTRYCFKQPGVFLLPGERPPKLGGQHQIANLLGQLLVQGILYRSGRIKFWRRGNLVDSGEINTKIIGRLLDLRRGAAADLQKIRCFDTAEHGRRFYCRIIFAMHA